MSNRASICPQRILNEAIRLLENCKVPEDEEEALDNNLQELADLRDRLYRQGVTKV